MYFSQKVLRPLFGEVEESQGKYSSHQIDAIKGIEAVKAAAAENVFRSAAGDPPMASWVGPRTNGSYSRNCLPGPDPTKAVHPSRSPVFLTGFFVSPRAVTPGILALDKALVGRDDAGCMSGTMERATAKPATRRSVFIFRFASTAVLWSISLLIIFSGYELAFFGLISAVGLIALWEFYGMLDHKGLPNFKVTAMICGAAMLVGSFYYFSLYGPARSYDYEMAVLWFFLLTVITRQMFDGLREDAPLRTMAYTLFGLLYVLWLFNFMTKIVYVTPRGPHGEVTGQFYVFYCIAITKFSDMGAYLTGSVLGRHPLVPHISPKKTWEGFFGALAFSLLASLGLYALMPPRLSVLNWTHAVVLGLLLGFAAVVGDLAESIIKRSTGVKDSGNMLPGIGGALDLIDSLLFTAPLLFFYLRLVVRVP